MLNFSHQPPSDWAAIINRSAYFFHSAGWQSVLEHGFDARTLYGWDAGSGCGIAVTLFKAGPFRIGYSGFPVGGSIGNGHISPDDLAQALIRARLGVQVLRVPISGFSMEAASEDGPDCWSETAIVDLQRWSLDARPKLQRDVSKAQRSALRIDDTPTSHSGVAFFRLYKETVRFHQGQLRYTPAYFSSLADLAMQSDQLRCFSAYFGDHLVAFVVVALHSDVAYYLHGGQDRAYKKLSGTDRLISQAIAWAKGRGMRQFNLMSSPPGQESLVHYKEKWGGETRWHTTREFALLPFWARAFKIVRATQQALLRVAQ